MFLISPQWQYASVEKEGEWFMTHEDFVCRYLQLASPEDNANTVKFLADVADTNKTRLVGPEHVHLEYPIPNIHCSWK